MATLKYSRQRESIKEFLRTRTDHPTADVVYENMKLIYPNISLGTVYRNLSLLADLGEIKKLSSFAGADHFDGRTERHCHFMCIRCERIIDLESEGIHHIMDLAGENFKGKITDYSARFFGSKIQDALQLRGALESKAAFLAAQNCTPLDAAELQLIIARLDSTQDEKIRGDLDRDLHLKIAQISANPLILSVLNASAQITENMIVGIRSYLMQKNNDAPEIDSQHTRLVQAITNNDAPLAEKVMNEHMHTIEYLLNEITSDNLTISDNVQQP